MGSSGAMDRSRSPNSPFRGFSTPPPNYAESWHKLYRAATHQVTETDEETNCRFLESQDRRARRSAAAGVFQAKECAVCHKRFASRPLLKAHLREHAQKRLGLFPFQCSLCDGRFDSGGELARHLRSHSEKRPLVCGVCGKRYTKYGSLEKHARRGHGLSSKAFQCAVCKNKFGESHLLRRHIRTHLGGDRPFKCGLCSATFARVDGLKRHLQAHAGDKPYQCDGCDKKFARLEGMRLHRNVHCQKHVTF